MSVNRFICTGNLTRDPELRQLPTGVSVCELRVAVDAMGRGVDPGFINVSVYGKPGEAAAEILGKGWLVGVDGRLEFGEWETDVGDKRHEYTVVGNAESLPAPRATETQPNRGRAARREPVTA